MARLAQGVFIKINHSRLPLAAAVSLLATMTSAHATTLTFEDLAVGTTLNTQYAASGATFIANAFTGAGSSSSGAPWATNTDMTVVSSTGTDVGGLGTPAGTVSGNVLHSFAAWLNEDGDPSFTVQFSSPMGFFSAAFAGVFAPADVTLWAYDGTTLVGIVSGTVTTGQFTLSLSAPSITSVAVRPGTFNDWVGVDNITFTPAVPEPASYGLMALGIGLLALRRRAPR